jgi:SAM-dependent methyltransferase
MNGIHNRLCRSDGWNRKVEQRLLPWALDGVDLGDDVLEIGPGFGATTRILADRVPRLTAVEINPKLAEHLRATLPTGVNIVNGDGTDLPFPDGTFDGVVCFTMLHHVPSRDLQDRLFAQAHRVLAPGGVFAGSDSRLSLRFRVLHIGDVMVPVDPAGLADRLRTAGFTDVEVSTVERSLKFRARR